MGRHGDIEAEGTAGRGAPHIGLALAGGGPLGGIYEVGAIAALADSLEGVDFNAVDIFVGVSSGSFIAAALANGLGPDKLARMLMDNDAEEVFDPDVLLRPAFVEYWRRIRALPPLVFDAVRHYLAHPLQQGFFESFQRLSRALPTGVFDNAGIDQLLSRLFSGPGRTNDFRELPGRLFLIATDLDSGATVEFGGSGWDHVPISRAVQASAALPGLFPPVRIDGRHFVDGALIKTLHASVALREGAELVFCINPLVPFDASLASASPGPDSLGSLVEGGLPVVLSQTFRAIIHSRMRVGMDRYRHHHPGQDVVLFEPARDDAEMFFANVFSYRSRRHLCEHAFQRTRQDLWRRRQELGRIFERHGIRLRLSRLRDPHRTLRVLGRAASLRQTTLRLDNALDELEAWMAQRT